jgi:hypothetical protein
MMQVIDEDYIRNVFALPDGPTRLLGMITGLMNERDTAQEIARAAANNVKPLVRQNSDLLNANNRLVFEKRDLQRKLDNLMTVWPSRRATQHDVGRQSESPGTFAMLKELEWSGATSDKYGDLVAACPVCETERGNAELAKPHTEDCRLAKILMALPEPPVAGEAGSLLAWFDKRRDLDLSYVRDMEPSHIPQGVLKPGPIPDQGWAVHRKEGGWNDREWLLISFEESAIGALREAHKVFTDARRLSHLRGIDRNPLLPLRRMRAPRRERQCG